ncbi:MAG TPA: hypothetical protein VMW78_09975 [Anaerolineae bacterium]|nr:hypothetical protein [Anaerolineae bacterium]
MVIVEFSQKGVGKIYVQHAGEDEEVSDFLALQFVKPRLIALHAVLKDSFQAKSNEKKIKATQKNYRGENEHPKTNKK